MKKPYTLRMNYGQDERVVGFYATADAALDEGRNINKNRLRSGGPECVESLTVTHDLPGKEPVVIHASTARMERKLLDA